MSRRLISFVSCIALVCSGCLAQEESNSAFKDWYRGWNVQTGVANAQVIMVARVTHVGKVKVVEGAKTNQYFREFRFQPLRIIKGVYDRPELTMSAQDLGCQSAIGVAANDVQEGQLRLLMLAQSNPLGTSFGCASVSSTTNFRQAVPLLSKLSDPIVDTYESMIRINNLRSRKQRVELLAETIGKVDGPAVIPLLNVIRNDMIWAAATSEFAETLLELSENPDAIVAETSFELVCQMPQWFTTKTDKAIVDRYAARIKKHVTVNEIQPTSTRLAALSAAIQLEKLSATDWLTKLLVNSVSEGRTIAEQNLAISGLGELKAKRALPALSQRFNQLPLDSPVNSEKHLFNAINQIDEPALFELIQVRLDESLLAVQPPHQEIHVLAESKGQQSTKILLKTLDDPRAMSVHRDVIVALGDTDREDVGNDVVEKLGDLARTTPSLKPFALQALMKIGTYQAAIELRPHLKTLRQLSEKLPLAEVLARHGMDDGYSMAIEHLADGGTVTRNAAEVLRVIDNPKSKQQLLEILDKRPDRKWFLGSAVGLLAMNEEKGKQAFVEIVSDDRHPLLTSALPFSDLAGKETLIDHATHLVESRNDNIALLAIAEIRKVIEDEPLFLGEARVEGDAANATNPSAMASERKLLESLKTIAVDSYVNSKVRIQALNLMAEFKTSEIDETLVDIVDQVDRVDRNSMQAAQIEIKKREIDLRQFQ